MLAEATIFVLRQIKTPWMLWSVVVIGLVLCLEPAMAFRSAFIAQQRLEEAKAISELELLTSREEGLTSALKPAISLPTHR